MTKHHPPLSWGDALGRIAGQLPGGHEEMARICDRNSISTIYNWGNPETPESCPIEMAKRLDQAFQRAGGVGAPMWEAFGSQLQAERVSAIADQIGLARRITAVIKEGGEAHTALAELFLPNSNEDLARVAVKEVEEALRELTGILPELQRLLAGRYAGVEVRAPP